MGELSDENNNKDEVTPPVAPQTPEAKTKSEILAKKKSQRRLGMAIGLGIVAIFAAGLFTMISVKGPDDVEGAVSTAPQSQAKGALKPYATGTLAKLISYEAPKTLTDIEFYDADKKPLNIAAFKGDVLIVNVWATWCAPCRVEMPTLANLQTHYPGARLKVLPLSIDTDEKLPEVKSFMGVHEPLGIYVDPHFAVSKNWGVEGLPTTLIIDKQGREVARLEGEAHWDQPEVKALIDHLLAQ